MKKALESLIGRNVSRETWDKLIEFERLLRVETGRQNLISSRTLEHLWPRHLLDSAQLVRFAGSNLSWLDVGSGAGLPGIVISILQDGPVTLVEPRKLRATFLEQCVETLGLSETEVIQDKVQKISSCFDVITARAVARTDRIFEMAHHASTARTLWILPKGRSAKSELDEATRKWQGEFRLEQSQTDPEASILIASGVYR